MGNHNHNNKYHIGIQSISGGALGDRTLYHFSGINRFPGGGEHQVHKMLHKMEEDCGIEPHTVLRVPTVFKTGPVTIRANLP